jgi:glutamine synthetase
MLCFAPNPNSYRRVQAGALAPSGKNWGYDHRDVALRIPRSNEQSRRIEHRVAGADANPYLVLAAVLAGIHWGLGQQGDPGAPVLREADLSEDETSLPIRLDDAIRFFSDSQIMQDYLGEKFTRVYGAIRRGESNDYYSQIPDLDYQWYLRAL